jgi:hypothetical protein
MSVDESKSRGFPTLGSTVWWGLRSRFQRSMPSQVDAQYLETVLGIAQKSARNIAPQLRTLGLIDNDGKTTPLANEWRTDEGYAVACAQIIESVYPASLRDAVPPDGNVDRDAAARWFMRERKVGAAQAKVMAALYALIAQADPTGAESQRAPRSDRAGAGTGTRPTAGASKRASQPMRTTQQPQQNERQPSSSLPAHDERRSTAPALHIDVQVHIPSDATVGQIDAIFSSMAKHLYQQKS